MFEFFYNFGGLNQQLFLSLNHLLNISILPYFLQIFSFIFAISNFAICYLIYSLYFFWQLINLNNTEQCHNYFWNRYNKLSKVGIAYTIFGLFYAFLKFTVNLPRPFCSLPPEEFITIADLSHERCLSSFPSAHTGLSLLVIYFLWEHFNQKRKFVAVFVILLVALSRIVLAMHYPADIIYSLLITIFLIKVSEFIYCLLKDNIIKKVGNIILKLNRSLS